MSSPLAHHDGRPASANEMVDGALKLHRPSSSNDPSSAITETVEDCGWQRDVCVLASPLRKRETVNSLTARWRGAGGRHWSVPSGWPQATATSLCGSAACVRARRRRRSPRSPPRRPMEPRCAPAPRRARQGSRAHPRRACRPRLAPCISTCASFRGMLCPCVCAAYLGSTVAGRACSDELELLFSRQLLKVRRGWSRCCCWRCCCCCCRLLSVSLCAEQPAVRYAGL
jgi:hypothetical protein